MDYFTSSSDSVRENKLEGIAVEICMNQSISNCRFRIYPFNKERDEKGYLETYLTINK